MRQLGNALACLDLRAVAAAALINQTGYERRLEKQHQADRHNLPAIPLPDGRVAKVDLATRRKSALADVPALHFLPIVLWCSKPHRWHLDVARNFAREDPDRDICSSLARLQNRYVWPPNDLGAE